MTELKKVTSGRQKSGLLKPDQRRYLRRLFTVFVLGVVGLGTFGNLGGGGYNNNGLTDKDYENANRNIKKLQDKERREAERKRREAEREETWERFKEIWDIVFGNGERS